MRPTFQYNGNPVRACGIIFWTKIQGVRWNLLRHYKGKWQDIGGKTDVVDNNILSTATREVCEETNGKLTPKKIRKLLKNGKTKKHYSLKSKYLLFSCHVEKKHTIPIDKFGTSEKGLPHKFKWFKTMPPLHYRLQHFRL